MKFKDLTGQKFGKLTAIKRVADHIEPCGHHYTMWLCKCDCGNFSKVRSADLIGDHIKSCGCQNIKHMLSKHPLYKVLSRMHSCCYNKNCNDYKDYGARGIELCDQWNKDVVGISKAVKNFVGWSESHGYKRGLSIDRINNSGNYEPSNCRWATMTEQCNNRRNNHFIEFNGEKLTISQWARKYNIGRDMLKSRIERGWEMEKALVTPLIKR